MDTEEMNQNSRSWEKTWKAGSDFLLWTYTATPNLQMLKTFRAKNVSQESFTFTMRGMAILLGERAHLESPSILLPPGGTAGSIFNIADEILDEFGIWSPSPPKLQPNTESLEPNTEYTFQSILRTMAGSYPSNLIRVRPHTMSDTSGISVCFGNAQDSVLLRNVKMALREMKVEPPDPDRHDALCQCLHNTRRRDVQLDGTSVVAPAVEYQRALQLTIPSYSFIESLHADADDVYEVCIYRCVQSRRGTTPPTPAARTADVPSIDTAVTNQPCPRRGVASVYAPAHAAAVSPPQAATSTFVNQPAASATSPLEPTLEDTKAEPAAAADSDSESVRLERSATMEKRMSRTGTMNREFKSPRPVSVRSDEWEGELGDTVDIPLN
ncbi:hypothetical protein B0H12DRAFT_1238404 [Mycena haematopus]|nr:hypothetical protein B0H12DRAFT_1238404 [Mycena haematopus]